VFEDLTLSYEVGLVADQYAGSVVSEQWGERVECWDAVIKRVSVSDVVHKTVAVDDDRSRRLTCLTLYTVFTVPRVQFNY